MPDEPKKDGDREPEAELERRLRELLGDDEPELEPVDPKEPRFPTIPRPEEIELTLRDRDEENLGRLNQGVDEVSARSRSELSEADAELEERLKKLDARAGEFRATHEAKKAVENRARQSEQSSAKGLGVGLSIAYTIIGLPVVGAGIGWLIDEQAGTNVWKGYTMLIGAILGIGMAFYLLNRANQGR